MMRVNVVIEKTNQTLNFDFDNVVPRDEVEHRAYTQFPALKVMKDTNQIESKDFYLTWYYLDNNGNIIQPDFTEDATETLHSETVPAGTPMNEAEVEANKAYVPVFKQDAVVDPVAYAEKAPESPKTGS